MKTSRLAVPANSCGGSRRRVSTPPFRFGNPILRAAAAVLLSVGFSAPASALTLAWNPNPETDIASYQLSYGTSPGVHPVTVSAGSSTSASVAGLQEGATYYFVVRATNQAGLQSAPSMEISYQVPAGSTPPPPPPTSTPPPSSPPPALTLVSSSGWKLKYASSQEIEDEDGRAVNAFDGDPRTIWHSRFFTNSAPPPHELQIDLGTAQTLQGFRYLPRQDEYMHGTIARYEFYVSMDGVTWGAPVAEGTFAFNQTEKEVLFASKSGRFVRLVALTDGNGGTVASVAEINLLQGTNGPVPVNQVPVAAAQSVSTPEDKNLSITLSAADPDGNPLTYTVVSGPSSGSLDGNAPNLTYVPDADFNGSDSFTFRANDGSANSNTATISITVAPVNDAPVALSRSAGTAENIGINIVMEAGDKDGDTLTYTIVNGPGHGKLAGAAPVMSYTPDAGYNGVDSFTFRANDGTANSNTATVSINVTPVNDPPVAASSVVDTAEDTPVSIILSAGDADGDSLSYVIVSGPGKGSLSGTPPDLTYVPAADFNGPDSFTFRASDGAVVSNTATVSITVRPVNDAPVAVSAESSTLADEPVSFVLTASDRDGDPLTYAIVSGPGKGTLSGTAPNLTYTPSSGFSGPDSFTFRANDGEANSNPATVTITVNAVAPPPPPNIRPSFAADPIFVSVAEDSAVSGQLDASDPDEGSVLEFSKVSGPSWLTVSPSGLLVGTPSNQDVGVNAFTVQVADAWGASTSANLIISVSNTNDAPVFILNPIRRPAGDEEVAYDGESIADTAADADAGDSISYSKVSGPDWLVIAADGALSGTPPAGSSGANTFAVRATDKSGASGDSVLRIEIRSSDLPLPWELADLGDSGPACQASFDSGNFTLDGSGNLAGSSDSGGFLWQSLSGDGSITARLISPADGGRSSLAGVMIRDSLASNSPHVFMGMDGRGWFRWTRRSSAGAWTSISTAGWGRAPDVWLRLVRSGRTVTAYKSTDGRKWSRVGAIYTRFASHCYIGLAVASGEESPGSATFTEVEVNP